MKPPAGPPRAWPRGPAILQVLVVLLGITAPAITAGDRLDRPGDGPDVVIHGALEVFQRISLDILGPPSSETGEPNPFLDVRLDVRFEHLGTGDVLVVPGAFVADGKAAETGAAAGRVWRAHLSPHEAGSWTWTISFRQGPGVALVDDVGPFAPLLGDATTGVFEVAPASSPSGSSLRDHGRLVHDGGHHLRHAASGEPWLQAGVNSPENLLAYVDFDQTPDGQHAYAPHRGDWQAGDPTWHDGTKGKGLVGALNYLASVGVNTVNALVFNVGGDGDDVWPWTSKTERLRYDVSKLAQWELVFEHMDELGIAPQLLLGEQEIDDGPTALDGGELGPERMLFHRELLARFGHHLGLTINLGEENQNTTAQQVAFYEHLVGLDAYGHPITVHTFPTTIPVVYPPLLEAQVLEGASLQVLDPKDVHATTLDVRRWSIDAGRPWIVNLDEIGPPSDGVLPDNEDFWHDVPRIWVLWGNLMAGGGGSQWYFGYGWPHDDLDLEDFRSREHMFELAALARGFFEDHLPYPLMDPADELVQAGDAWVLAQPGNLYAAYLPFGGEVSLALPEPQSTWRVSWFDPRHGGPLLSVGTLHLPLGGSLVLEAPASAPSLDWVARLERLGAAPDIGGVSWGSGSEGGGDPDTLAIEVEDPDGASDVVSVSVHVLGPGGGTEVILPAQPSGGPLWLAAFGHVVPKPGAIPLKIEATDSQGHTSQSMVVLPPPGPAKP